MSKLFCNEARMPVTTISVRSLSVELLSAGAAYTCPPKAIEPSARPDNPILA